MARGICKTHTPLTDCQSLIAVLDTGIKRFLDGFVPLNSFEDKRLSKAVALVKDDPDTIIRNSSKKRTWRILIKLLSISFEAFFLCAIGSTLDAISKLRWSSKPRDSYSFFNPVERWWCSTTKPVGLTQAMKHYANKLPGDITISPKYVEELHLASGVVKTQNFSVATLSLHNLLDFVKGKYADEPVQIKFPVDELLGPPSVKFGSINMEFHLDIAVAIIRHIRSMMEQGGNSCI